MPLGNITSCCLQSPDSQHNPSIQIHGIDDVRRSDYWNQIRKDLLDGVQHPSCNFCWKLENQGIQSHREIRNQQFSSRLNAPGFLDINADGTLAPHSPVRLWDVRDTNICNMKCVICGPSHSSLWNEESLKYHSVYAPVGHNTQQSAVISVNDISRDDVLAVVKENIRHVSGFYFAGGEPLISRMHWDILQTLVDDELFQTDLAYNTNMSKLTWQGKDAIDYWKKFRHVNVCASIDAVGARAEYVRYGTNWATIDSNIRTLLSMLPKVISISISTSVFSLGGLKSTLDWTKDLGIEDQSKIYKNNVVYTPLWANIKILTRDLKAQLWEKVYKDLESDPRAYHSLEKELFDELDDETLTLTRKKFKKNVITLDEIRKTDIKTVCPELVAFISGIED